MTETLWGLVGVLAYCLAGAVVASLCNMAWTRWDWDMESWREAEQEDKHIILGIIALGWPFAVVLGVVFGLVKGLGSVSSHLLSPRKPGG